MSISFPLDYMASVVPPIGKQGSTDTKRRSFRLVHGRRLEYDKPRDPVHFVRPVSDQSINYVYTFYGEKVAIITEIELINRDGIIDGATARIDQGGSGKSFVEIVFTSKPGRGVNYVINIRALNRIRDIRDTRSAGPVHSPYNLIEGGEIVDGAILRPPVMSIASANDDRVFFDYYGSPDSAITRIEVLDYSENAEHGCMPIVGEGGVGTDRVEIKCARKPRCTAKFLVKIYVFGDERTLHEAEIEDQDDIVWDELGGLPEAEDPQDE